MAAGAERDFFVSYNERDRHWAEWIAWQLEDAGYTTVLQAWDFVPGSNFVVEMDRAAELARRTIAVLSPDYLAASFTQPEWAAAFAQDPEGLSRTLVTVRVRECNPTGLLGQLVYIDLVGLPADAARDRLLTGLQARAKPQQEPSFPGATTDTEPSFPGERPPSPQPGQPAEPESSRGIWVKLNDDIFAADELDDEGTKIRVSGDINADVVRRLERLRESRLGTSRVRLVYGDRVVTGNLTAVHRSIRGDSTKTTIELDRVEPVRADALRSGTGGMSADDLIELGLRNLLLGERLPAELHQLRFLTDTGVDQEALSKAFVSPDAADATRLILADGLIGNGNAAAITRFELGPLQGGARWLAIEWDEPRAYTNVEPGQRRLEGSWRAD